jgi:hypothetical protein
MSNPSCHTMTETTSPSALDANSQRRQAAEAMGDRHAAAVFRQHSGREEIANRGYNVGDVSPGSPSRAGSTIGPTVPAGPHEAGSSPSGLLRRTPTGKSLRRRSGREPSIEASVTSTRTGSSRPSSSRRSTTPASSLPSSHTSSRQSSVTSHGKTRPPLATSRSVGAGHRRRCSADALALHRRSVQLFAPCTAARDPPPTSTRGMRRHTSPTPNPVGPAARRDPNASHDSVGEAQQPIPDPPYRYDNYVPATSIDWTLPSTRAREYRQIDRSCRGLRGLWRKISPRWCRRNSRLNFFDEDDQSDGGSVRRYRVELARGEDGRKDGRKDGKGFSAGEIEPDSRPTGRLKKCWSFSGSKAIPVEGFGSAPSARRRKGRS